MVSYNSMHACANCLGSLDVQEWIAIASRIGASPTYTVKLVQFCILCLGHVTLIAMYVCSAR